MLKDHERNGEQNKWQPVSSATRPCILSTYGEYFMFNWSSNMETESRSNTKRCDAF